MNHLEGRCGATLRSCLVGVVSVLAVVVSSTVQAGVSAATPVTPAFNGTYTAVQKTSTIDPRSGARVDGPDEVGFWIVASICPIRGCTAHAVKIGKGLDLVFDGTQWNQLAVPPTGTCRGATVPAQAAALFLVPQSDGTLSGAVTSTVNCDGLAIDTSLPLTLTPS